MNETKQRSETLEYNSSPRCARCDNKECRQGKDCFGQADTHTELYADPEIKRLQHAAAGIEAKYYGQKTRLGEVLEFARCLDCKRIGLAFCVGLSEEARIIEGILSEKFDVVSVCCKACGIDKKDFDLPYVRDSEFESTCNPAGQADLLNKAGSELNVVCGLCVGHDAIFSKASQAPVVTLIAKDRVLAHNPAAALYCQYIRKRFNQDT
jgi:uncharacterized metal-binding protein